MPAPLLRSSRFLPLFITQFTGALNDNLIKNGMVVLIAYRAGDAYGGGPLIAAAGAVFILPYVLFSALAGRLADHLDKARLIRLNKLCEIALMVLAAVGFMSDSLPVLFAVLFGLGIQATFFGPLKYGILPDHLLAGELLAGNGLIEAGTFAAILVGTIAGGAMIGLPSGPTILSLTGVAVSLAGVASAFAIPAAPPQGEQPQISWSIVRDTRALLREARGNRAVWGSILGISWFFTFGSIFIPAFPVIGSSMLHADSTVVTLMLTMFTLGIGVGALLAARLLKGEISARHVPYAGLALSLFAVDFALTVQQPGLTLHTLSDFFHSLAGGRIMADLFLVALAGGIFSVPLYAIMQDKSPVGGRSRMVGANNIVNAGFMVGGAAFSAVLAGQGISQPTIIILVAAANALVAGFILRALRARVRA